MLGYDLDQIADVAAAPTIDSIERQRQQQLLAVRNLRRLLSRQALPHGRMKVLAGQASAPN